MNYKIDSSRFDWVNSVLSPMLSELFINAWLLLLLYKNHHFPYKIKHLAPVSKDLCDSLNCSWNVFPLDFLGEPQSLDGGFIQTSVWIKSLSPLANKATQHRTACWQFSSAGLRLGSEALQFRAPASFPQLRVDGAPMVWCDWKTYACVCLKSDSTGRTNHWFICFDEAAVSICSQFEMEKWQKCRFRVERPPLPKALQSASSCSSY